MRCLTFFFHTKSSKLSVHFIIRTYLSSDKPYFFKCSNSHTGQSDRAISCPELTCISNMGMFIATIIKNTPVFK